MRRFTIKGRLPNYNDVTSANRAHAQAGARLKRETEQALAWQIATQKIKPVDHRVDVIVTWYEPNDKRDPDNIYSAVKFILDVLQPMHPKLRPYGLGIIRDDSQRFIRNISHVLGDDPQNPRIQVQLTEVM